MVVHRSRNLNESPTLISDQSLTLKGFSRLLRPRRSGTLIFMFAHKKGISAQGCAGLTMENKRQILECSEVGTNTLAGQYSADLFLCLFSLLYFFCFLFYSLLLCVSILFSLPLARSHTHTLLFLFSLSMFVTSLHFFHPICFKFFSITPFF